MFRSYLFTPGDSERKIEKALGSCADCVILDLEDSVADASKDKARTIVRAVLSDIGSRHGLPKIYVRVNELGGDCIRSDIEMLSGLGVDGIVLPKCESIATLRAFDSLLSDVGFMTVSEGDDRLCVIAIATETASSVFGLGSYADIGRGGDDGFHHIRLSGLAWGCEDLSADIGATDNRDAAGSLCAPYALVRNLCLFAAHAASIEAIDGIYPFFGDESGLAAACAASAYDGFTGKLAIHPAQLGIIHAHFTPDSARVEEARRIVAAFSSAADGAGVVGLDGQMVDRPHVVRSRRLLERHHYFLARDKEKEGGIADGG